MRHRISVMLLCAAGARAYLRARQPLRLARCARAYAAKDDLAELETQLARHDDLYYNQAAPELTDVAYDALARRVDALKKTQGVTQPRSVGAKRGGTLAKAAPHATPMLSLETLKVKDGTVRTIAKWLKKAMRACAPEAIEAIVAEPKLDGLSVSLTYENGVLKQAATRGDGVVGDDVTRQLLEGCDIPTQIDDFTGDIRGEVIIPVAFFRALPKEAAVSARNYAAGSLRQKNASEVKGRGLCFVVHDVVGLSENYGARRERAEKWGFELAAPSVTVAVDYDVPEDALADHLEACAEQLSAYHEMLGEQRPFAVAGTPSNKTNELPYEIDGVVFKVDASKADARAGTTARAPRARVALKFDKDAIIVATTLLDVDIQIGRLGALTPVAKLEPVNCGGVTVSSATLHNFDVLRASLGGARIGDQVLVKRAGDVIPQIAPAVEGQGDAWPLPATCPCCGGPTTHTGDGQVKCTGGLRCGAQAVGRLQHALARGALDLGSGALGKKKMEQLVQEDVLRSAADLLDFVDDRATSLETLAALDGWAATSAAKVLDALEARVATPIPLAGFIYALGAPRIGKTTAKRVAGAAGSWSALRRCLDPATVADDALRVALVEARGVGPAAVAGFLEFFGDAADAAVADRLAARLDVLDDTSST